MLYVFKAKQIMYGFDISEFGGKVVSMTVRSTHMTYFFVNFRQFRGELGQKIQTILLINLGLFF